MVQCVAVFAHLFMGAFVGGRASTLSSSPSSSFSFCTASFFSSLFYSTSCTSALSYTSF